MERLTDPSTPAGRADHDMAWNDTERIAKHHWERQGCAGCAGLAKIEAQARAEGRREAVDRILELLSLFTDDAHPSITHIRDIVLESVAGLNASESRSTDDE